MLNNDNVKVVISVISKFLFTVMEISRLMEAAIDNINPAAVLIGGDLMVAKEWVKKDFTVCKELLIELSKKYPIYYGNGNHEQRLRENPDKYPGWYSEYRNFLDSIRVKYLEDKTVILNKKDENINIAGENKIVISGLDIDKKFYNRGFRRKMSKSYVENKIGKIENNDKNFHILLAHSPRYFDTYSECGIDLVLSGHLHGGIVRVPFLGGIVSTQFELFPKWDRGLFEINESKMIVSGGLGTHSIPVRLFNMPELIVIRLKSCVNS